MENAFEPNKNVAACIDPKGNVVLAEFGRDALLFRGGQYHPYVVAHGYDRASGEWSHGNYMNDLSDAWERAMGAVPEGEFELRITRDMVRDGIETGLIRFENNPAFVPDTYANPDLWETVCAIGDNWFYFADTEGISPADFIAMNRDNLDQVVDDVFEALDVADFSGNGIPKEEEAEYLYYYYFLKENLPVALAEKQAAESRSEGLEAPLSDLDTNEGELEAYSRSEKDGLQPRLDSIAKGAKSAAKWKTENDSDDAPPFGGGMEER